MYNDTVNMNLEHCNKVNIDKCTLQLIEFHFDTKLKTKLNSRDACDIAKDMKTMPDISKWMYDLIDYNVVITNTLFYMN